MSLKKKIILAFLISSIIIAILVIAGYINFIGIKKEIRYLYSPDPERRLPADKGVLEAIRDPRTRGIIFGPGSFITSVMPHILVKGIAEALAERRKKDDIPIVLVLNPSIDNETAEYTISYILEFIERKTGRSIDDMFTDLVINKFDTTKVENHFDIYPKYGDKPKSAKWYVNRVLENPRLVDELGLSYFKHLINKFLSMTGRTAHALNSPHTLRFSISDDDGKLLTLNDEKELNLTEYMEIGRAHV